MLKTMPRFSKSFEVFLERECIQEEAGLCWFGNACVCCAAPWAPLSSPIPHVLSCAWLQVTSRLLYLKGHWLLFNWPLVVRFSEPSICATADSCQTWPRSWSVVLVAASVWSWPCVTCRGPVHRLGRLPVEFSCWEALTAVLSSWLLFSSISKW